MRLGAIGLGRLLIGRASAREIEVIYIFSASAAFFLLLNQPPIVVAKAVAGVAEIVGKGLD